MKCKITVALLIGLFMFGMVSIVNAATIAVDGGYTTPYDYWENNLDVDIFTYTLAQPTTISYIYVSDISRKHWYACRHLFICV